jgi:secondary thiamine-phosphate synthase enzyme
MRQASGLIEVDTQGRGLTDIGPRVTPWLAAQSVDQGLLTLFCRHTSASLLIQENAAPAARADLLRFFETIAPEDPERYQHDEEGPDDMPAHLRAALTQTQLSIPVIDGRPALGTWQGIYLFEHRRAPHRRSVALHLIGQ